MPPNIKKQHGRDKLYMPCNRAENSIRRGGRLSADELAFRRLVGDAVKGPGNGFEENKISMEPILMRFAPEEPAKIKTTSTRSSMEALPQLEIQDDRPATPGSPRPSVETPESKETKEPIRNNTQQADEIAGPDLVPLLPVKEFAGPQAERKHELRKPAKILRQSAVRGSWRGLLFGTPERSEN